MRLLLSVLLLPACLSNPVDDTSGTKNEGTIDDPYGLGCGVTLSEQVVTIPSVRWHAEGGVASYVEFGRDSGYGMVSPMQSGSEPDVPLYGMPGDTTVYFRAVTEAADGTSVACTGTITTGTVPAEIPRVLVDVDDRDQQSPGAYFYGVMFQPGYSPIPHFAGFNRDGEIVWYASGDQNMIPTDLQFAIDGNDILYNEFAPDWSTSALIRRISMRGEEVREVQIPYGHHMFAQLPDGTLAFNAIDPRLATSPVSLESEWIVGDAIGEVSPDGAVTTAFSVWDWLEVTTNPLFNQQSMYPQGKDWTHGNALKYDAVTGHYLLSLGHADVIMDIDRATATPTQMYGLAGIPVAAGSFAFDYQHDPSFTAEGHLLMFTTAADHPTSGAVEYEVADGELHEVWSHGLDGNVFAPMLGQAMRQDNGNTVVNYGGGGQMEEVLADGTVVWHARPDGQGAVFAQMRLIEDIYAGR